MKNRKIPMRRCIGCMESKPKNQLIRIACYEGQLAVDETGRSKGRGVYMCRNHECMEKAKKRRSLQRSLQMEFEEETVEKIYRELAEHEQ